MEASTSIRIECCAGITLFLPLDMLYHKASNFLNIVFWIVVIVATAVMMVVATAIIVILFVFRNRLAVRIEAVIFINTYEIALRDAFTSSKVIPNV